MSIPSILSKTSRQAADVIAVTSRRYIGKEKRSIRSKIHRTMREAIELIQDTSDNMTNDLASKLALVEESNKVEDEKYAAEEVVGEAISTPVI